MKKLLRCYLLPIPIFFSAFSTHAQVPPRDNFTFLFENNYDNDKLGSYTSTDFVPDWNMQAGSSPNGNVQIINDDATHKSVMRANYPKGTIGPTSSHGFTWYSWFSTKGEEIYFSYDVRFKPGFEWVLGGKIPGVVGGSVTSGQLPTSTSGFSSRLVWKSGGSLVFYLYYPDQTGIYGDVYGFDGFNFETGKWYNLTMRIVLNSVINGTANADGILEGYVDGILRFQKTGIRLRRSETIKIERMYLCSFFGGNTPEWGAAKDEWIDTDNYVAYVHSSMASNVPRGRQPNTTNTLLHPYYNFTGSVVSPSLPSAPSTLSYSSCNTTNAKINWTDNSSNETGFKIDRKTGSNSFIQVAQVGSNLGTFTDNSLSPSTSYTYRVYAYNSSGNSSYSNDCVFQTLSNGSAVNLALGKPSAQSTTVYNAVASRANDNNTNGAFSAASVIHTANEASPYWQVDLQNISNITNIEVWNRTDVCCVSRMANFYVFVSDNPFTSTNPLTTKNQSGVWSSFNTSAPNPSTSLTVNRSGRFVRIQLANQGELNIAEVKVFGSSGPATIPVPANPGSLTTQALTSTSVKLNWSDNSANEVGFRVDRKTSTGSYTQVAQVGSNIGTYSDNSVTPSTSYTYRVYAYNTMGNSGYSNESAIQTPANSSVINLATGKPSAQSSTVYGGVASRANDNNTNGAYSSGSVIHTGNEASPYWQVDLQSTASITNIEVWNRTDACCVSRMANYYVFVSDNPFTSTNPLTTKNQSGVWSILNSGYPNPSKSIPVNRSGRFVRVQLANQGELNLAEVKVFGSIMKIAGDITAVETVAEATLKMSIFPNPSYGNINIHFDLPEESQGSLGIFDISGRLLHMVAKGTFVAGINDFSWESSNAGPGIYIVKLAAGNFISVQKVLISR
jgi:hypothetical protein